MASASGRSRRDVFLNRRYHTSHSLQPIWHWDTQDNCFYIPSLTYFLPTHPAFTWMGGIRTSILLGELMWSISIFHLLVSQLIISYSCTFSWSMLSHWSGWSTAMQAASGFRRSKATGWNKIGLLPADSVSRYVLRCTQLPVGSWWIRNGVIG